MERFIEATLKALPIVASSPLALVGYVVVVLVWGAIAFRVKRNKQVLKYLKLFPPKDRLQVLREEMGTIPTKEGLSAEQYLKSIIHQYYFRAFVLLCLLILIIFVVSTFVGQRKEGKVGVDITPYREEPSKWKPIHSPGFDPENHSQADPVTVRSEKERSKDSTLSKDDVIYTYDRIKGKTEIRPENQYLECLSKGEEVSSMRGFDWQFPILSVKVVNNTQETLVLSEATIKVKDSQLNKEPIPTLHSPLRNPGKIYLENEGWGDVINPVVNLVIHDEESCNVLSDKNTIIKVIKLPTFSDFVVIDIMSYLPAELLKKQSLCVVGSLKYTDPNNHSHNIQFKLGVHLKPIIIIPEMMIVTHQYDAILKSGVPHDIERIPLSHEIKPGDSDLFLIRLGTQKSSRFDLTISLRSASGIELPGHDVLIDIFVPRSDSDRLGGIQIPNLH